MMAGNITLRETLRSWTDWDGAAYCLAVALGLIDPARAPLQTKAKHVFWSQHEVGGALHDMLEILVKLGVIERREEPDTQYRWNQDYRGTWE